MNEPDLEFAWVGDDAIDPLQQAQTLNILVSAGIKTRDEARAELGLGRRAEKTAARGVVLTRTPSNLHIKSQSDWANENAVRLSALDEDQDAHVNCPRGAGRTTLVDPSGAGPDLTPSPTQNLAIYNS